MAHKIVTLNYGDQGFRPDQDPVRVRGGDTLSFKLGTAPPHSRFKITLGQPQFFSVGEISNPNTLVHVHQAVSTKYHCQLLDRDGQILAQSSENQPGGGIEPDDL